METGLDTLKPRLPIGRSKAGRRCRSLGRDRGLVRNLASLVFCFMVLPALSGCAGVASGVTSAVIDKVFEPGPTKIEATFNAAEDLNPDYLGNASPLVVRLYELKSASAFDNSVFYALLDNDADELGDDLKGKDEWQILPGQTLSIERELQPEVRFVGILAGYRDHENASWRAVAEVEEARTTDLIIDLSRLAVTINVD